MYIGPIKMNLKSQKKSNEKAVRCEQMQFQHHDIKRHQAQNVDSVEFIKQKKKNDSRDKFLMRHLNTVTIFTIPCIHV